MADPLVQIARAAAKVKKADSEAAKAREELLRLMRREIEAGRATKSGVARAIGVSRQRVQEMLEP
jgi:hypothetical protein